ncbi:ABC transporter permease [Collinsella tanakaei]|uniref:ABC transporter permease n=1 Tax=Collinsella tanakaei TaxID=626935 RepID=UPI00195A8C88|nr:ABC transporter permease [Collinsella tanakaei]MBM6868420.1 ABC transporter permease [Collinsella tanakaei]
MSIRDLIREALRSLESNRGRSLLTILGIVIGIAAVIAMTSLIGGVRNSLISGLGLNAARTVQISCSYPMDTDDVADIARLMPEYEALEGSAYGYTQAQGSNCTVDANIRGADSAYLEMTGEVKLAEGRMFTSAEEQAAARVIILDKSGVQAFFGTPDAQVVGKSIRLGSHDYQIVGVDEKMPASSTGTENVYISVYTPLQTCLDDFSMGYPYLSTVTGLAREGTDMDAIVETTMQQVAKVMGIDEENIADNVYVYSMKSTVDTMSGFMNSFSLIMGAVAGISLLVGGIGIMNMMLTNVTERIREIGVRRALGATRRDITLQFLMESAVVCVAGGILGTVIGYLLSWGLSAIASALGLLGSMGMTTPGATATLTPQISPEAIAAAVGLSIAIGLIFGWYPARRAAKLDPVECLRSL